MKVDKSAVSRGRHHRQMDDARIGTSVRAVRLRKGLTQTAVARSAGTTRAAVGRLERGDLARLQVGAVRRCLGTLGMWLESTVHWRGTDLDRLLNRAHGALQVALLQLFVRHPGWTAIPEVSYSIYGERGAIDILAWHEATRSLLIVELKTMLVDPAELARTMDRRARLAPRIGRERGWDAATVSTWVVFTDTRTNRRHVRSHARILAALAAIDGRRIRTWLRAPDGAVAALSFWAEPAAAIARRVAPVRGR